MDMINEIISKYENFYDSLVTKLYITNDYKEGVINIDLEIRCMNSLNNFNFENLSFSLESVSFFQVFNSEKLDYLVPNGIFLTKQNDLYIIDLDPIISDNSLNYNENSNFIIKCKKLSYKIKE